MEMLKVLLVDDEILAMEDIRAMMEWEAHGYKIVAMSTSSTEALELYKKHRPQIIITDINMPVMNGLALCRELQKLAKNEPLKMILLTAYSDFDYAKSGFEIGVSNYILKHEISENRLLSELEKIRGQIQEKRRARRILQKEHLYELMTGKAGVEEFSVAMESMGLQKKAFLLVGAQVSSSSVKGTLSEDGLLSGEELEEVYIYETPGRGYYALAVINRINSQRHTSELIDDLVEGLRREIHTKLMTKAKIMTIPNCILPNELTKNYLRLQDGLRYCMFSDVDRVVCLENLKVSKAVDLKELENQIKQLSQDLKAGEMENIKERLENLFQKTTEPCWNINKLNRLCLELYHVLEDCLETVDLAEMNVHFSGNEAELANWNSVTEIKSYFLKIFLIGLKKIEEENCKSFSKKTQKIINYIHRHYSEFITIEDVAENTNISAVYLCQIFKKEMGVTFLEYLTDYRIKIAKDLLASGDYKIYEISQMVGYKTSQYFSQVFRKATGVNPLDYKK